MLNDSIKQPKEAELIFEFIEERSLLEELEFISIQNKKIIINHKDKYYSFHLNDNNINEYKIYEIFFHYKSSKTSNYITVYYDRSNYYICGRNKNGNSIEIIFIDFISNNIDISRCNITYNKSTYFPSNKDISNLRTRKRINLLNINLFDLVLPKDLQSNVININNLKEKSYLIIISVSEITQKVIGIYLNLPSFVKKDILIDEYIEKISQKVEKVKTNFNYNNKISFEEYRKYKNLNQNCLLEYSKDFEESKIIEKNINFYFELFRPNLSQKQIKLYDAYSDFLIAFPKMEYENKTLKYVYYWKQYYYSQRAIENFMKTIPSTVKDEDKIKLKYSACRCLQTMLFNGIGEKKDNLFYFFDVNSKDTIYNDAKIFNLKFIDSLTETSEIFLFFLQIDSGSSLNKLTGKLSARLSMLDHEQIKEHLKSSLPNYIIRINCETFFNAISFTETRITCFNEISLLGNFQDNEELQSNDDFDYNKRYLIANLMGHEDFGHIKFSINCLDQMTENYYYYYYIFEANKEPLSPIEYYNVNVEKEKNIEIKITEKRNGLNYEKGESGIAFNFFLTRGDNKLINLLRRRKVDFKRIFISPELLAKDDLQEYIDILKLISEKIDADNCPFILNESKGRYQINYKDQPIPTTSPTISKFNFI